MESSRAIATRKRAVGRIPEFDGLRGVAILLVIVAHFSQFSLVSSHPLTECGESGVLIFFVLSGYLITSILSGEVAITKRVNLVRFYIRRALRLLPAVWTLIAVVVLLKLVKAVTDENWVGVGASILYVRNIFGRGATLGHLWSLSLEEQFYFVWPLMFVLLPRHRLSAALVVFGTVAGARAICIALVPAAVPTGVFYLRPWFRFDSIMAGCVLALFNERHPEFLQHQPTWFRWLTNPMLAFAVIAVAGYFEHRAAVMPWALTIQTLACVAILANLAAPGLTWAKRVFSIGPLVFLGRISYSLYLWQQLFIVTKTPNWGFIRQPGVDLAAAMGCALASWYLIESPFLRLKSRWHAESPG